MLCLSPWRFPQLEKVTSDFMFLKVASQVLYFKKGHQNILYTKSFYNGSMYRKFSFRQSLPVSNVFATILSAPIVNKNHVYAQVRNENTGIFLKG